MSIFEAIFHSRWAIDGSLHLGASSYKTEEITVNYYTSEPKSAKIFKKIVIVVVLIVVLAAAWVIYNNIQSRKAQANVTVNIEYSKSQCNNPAYPLLVTIENKAAKTINNVTFYVEVYFPGNSNNLAHPEKYVNYKIVAPGKTVQTCYQLPKLDLSTIPAAGIPTDNSAYEYKIVNKSAVFK